MRPAWRTKLGRSPGDTIAASPTADRAVAVECTNAGLGHVSLTNDVLHEDDSTLRNLLDILASSTRPLPPPDVSTAGIKVGAALAPLGTAIHAADATPPQATIDRTPLKTGLRAVQYACTETGTTFQPGATF